MSTNNAQRSPSSAAILPVSQTASSAPRSTADTENNKEH